MKRALLTLSLAIVAVWSFLQFGGAQVVPQPGPPQAIACAYNTSPPTLTSGQAGWIQCDNAGQIKTTSSGGGGGAVTIADGADVTQGAIADVAATQGSTGTVSAKLRTITSQLNTISTSVPITALPRAARNFPGCTVGTSSGSCLAATTATIFLQIQNTHATNTIACAFGTSGILNSSTSIQLAPGQSASWGPSTAGVPSGAMNCIASGASTPLYVEWL